LKTVFVILSLFLNWLHEIKHLALGEFWVQQCDIVTEDPSSLQHCKPFLVLPEVGVRFSNDGNESVEEDYIREHSSKEEVEPNQVLTHLWV